MLLLRSFGADLGILKKKGGGGGGVPLQSFWLGPLNQKFCIKRIEVYHQMKSATGVSTFFKVKNWNRTCTCIRKPMRLPFNHNQLKHPTTNLKGFRIKKSIFFFQSRCVL